jgi:hypothetical protein
MKNLICFSLLFVLLGGFFHSVKATINCSNYTFEQLNDELAKFLKALDREDKYYYITLLKYRLCISENQSIKACQHLDEKLINISRVTILIERRIKELRNIIKTCFSAESNSFTSSTESNSFTSSTESNIQSRKELIDLINTP